MRSLHTRAVAIVQALSSWTKEYQQRFLGKHAEELTEVEAARIHSRMMRGSGGRRMSLDQIVAKSAARRRAAITHPGKRGKRGAL